MKHYDVYDIFRCVIGENIFSPFIFGQGNYIETNLPAWSLLSTGGRL